MTAYYGHWNEGGEVTRVQGKYAFVRVLSMEMKKRALGAERVAKSS